MLRIGCTVDGRSSIVGTTLAVVLGRGRAATYLTLTRMGARASAPEQLFPHNILREEAERLQPLRSGEEEDHLLRSDLLVLVQALADRLGSADERASAQVLWSPNVAREVRRLRPLVGLLIRLSDRAIEHDRAMDVIIIASDILAVLAHDLEFARGRLGLEVANIAGITVLRNELERHFLA